MGGTYPNTTTASLHLLLGYVAEGAMTATGTLLTITAGGGIVFTSADVGARIMVLGASTFGAPLFTTVSSFTDATHVNLTNPAATSVTATSQNIIIFRETKTATDYPMSGSVRFAQTLQARDTFSFQFVSRHSSASPSTTFAPAEGQPVLLVDDTSTLPNNETFGGTIDQVVITNMPGDQGIFADCLGITYDLLLSRKTTGVLKTYTNQTLGAIATDLVSLAAADGVTISTVTGPVIASYQTNYASIYDALDQICQLASNAVAQFKWYTDPRRVVHVVQIGTIAAPFNVSYSDASDQNILQLTSGGGTQGGFSATQTRQNYANRAIVKLNNLSIASLTETFAGDGATKAFETSVPIGAAPIIGIIVASPLSTIPQSVGVLGIDSGKDFYWNVGSNVITQDPSGTALDVSETLSVTYQGIDKSVVISTNTAEVARRAAVEGGTGVYELVQDAGTPASLADAQTLAAALSNSLGVIPETVSYGIYRGGLTVGMTQRIDILQLGVSDNFVIDSVTMTTANNLVLWQITATRGPTVLNWQNMLQGSIGTPADTSGGSTALAPSSEARFTSVRTWINENALGPFTPHVNNPTLPIRYNGYQYYAGVDASSGSHRFSVYRSSDDGRTWTALDDANAPTNAALIEGVVAFDGNAQVPPWKGGFYLHCALLVPNGTPSNTIFLQDFNLATEKWETSYGASGPAAQALCAIYIRPQNNTVFVTYDVGTTGTSSTTSRFRGLGFRMDTLAWGALAVDIGAEIGIASSGGVQVFATFAAGVVDPTGRLHFFIADTGFTYFLYQAIEISNSQRGHFFFFKMTALTDPLKFITHGNAVFDPYGRPVVCIVTLDSGLYNYRVLVGDSQSPSDAGWQKSTPIATLTS